jgi:hypothetical protein
MNMTVHTKYTKENTKYVTFVKTICDKKIEIFTNNKEDIEKSEHEAISKVFQHNKTCPKCLGIKQREEEYRIRNSDTVVQSKATCGEIMEIKQKGKLTPEQIRNMEHGVIHMVRIESYCFNCQVIYKRRELKYNREQKLNNLNVLNGR